MGAGIGSESWCRSRALLSAFARGAAGALSPSRSLIRSLPRSLVHQDLPRAVLDTPRYRGRSLYCA